MMARGACAVRPLGRADMAAFRDLRLRALREHPEAFGAAYEDEAGLPLEGFARWFPDLPGRSFGAFDGGALVGMLGLMAPAGAKVRHKGGIKGVYVAPSHRGRGLAAALLGAAVAHARAQGLALLQLSVEAGNLPARRVYEAAGFRTYGIEARSLRVGGAYFDEALMALDLDAG